MIYVISEMQLGGGWTPVQYYTSQADARRAVKAWAQKRGIHVSMSGNSASNASEGVRIYNVEEGMA